MAILPYLARDHRFYIKGVDDTEFVTEISGVNSWGFEIDNSEEDASVFNDGAWGSNVATQRTASFSLEGFFIVDALTGERDSGQLAFDRAATQVGFGAYRDFRIVAVTASGGVIGSITIRGTPGIENLAAGGVTDLSPWGGTVAVIGAPVGSGVYNIF